MKQTVEEANKLDEVLKFIYDTKVRQTTLDRHDIETVHLPSLIHKINELRVASLPTNSMPGWISVKDRLPHKDGSSSIDCLCYNSYHAQKRVLSFNEYHHCWDDESGDDYYTDAAGGKVSHWMPLPSAPTEPKQ